MRPGLRAAAPEALGLMKLGQRPVFTFSLTEEAQDERAPLHTDTYHVHTHSQTNPSDVPGAT